LTEADAWEVPVRAGEWIERSGVTYVAHPLIAKDTPMRQSLMRVALAVTAAAIVIPAHAQIPSAAAPPPAQWPPAAYSGSTYQPYPFPAPTPQDAYREGLISRWELERYEGPLPEALQGPPVDGSRGGDGGGGRD
jgi:hypothetical protein